MLKPYAWSLATSSSRFISTASLSRANKNLLTISSILFLILLTCQHLRRGPTKVTGLKGASISTINNPLASCSLIKEKLSIVKLQLKPLLNKATSRSCNQNHFRIKNCSIAEKSQLKPLQNKINSREPFYCPGIAIKNQFWTKTHFTFWQKNYSSFFCLYNFWVFTFCMFSTLQRIR